MRFPFENEDTMVQLSIYIHFCGTKILIRKKIELLFFSLTHDIYWDIGMDDMAHNLSMWFF